MILKMEVFSLEVGLNLNKYSESKKISTHEEWASNSSTNKEGS